MLFGFALYRVEGESMMPSLRGGDYLLVREDTGSRRPPSREDIVVVAQSGRSQVKRVIALPGERVALADGMLWIDGERLIEPYLHGLPAYLGLDESEFEIGSDEYFVMGDNRAHSTDSRDYGPVHRSRISGRVLVRIWPLLRSASARLPWRGS